MPDPARPARIAIVLKGYPRLSETFVAQEILGLESRGLALEIWSLRRPTDRLRHPMHDAIVAPVRYLPEYLYQDPVRVLRGLLTAVRHPAFLRLMATFWQDLRRDPTPNRLRRLGQALVLARELPPAIAHIHVHFLHTPASVARYAALLSGRPWSFSAHAKDIWTIPDWEKREKIAAAEWGVTCTAFGAEHLRSLAADRGDEVRLLYHGLDLARFPAPPEARAPRDGSDPADPVRIVTVGRLIAKKGFDDLIRALASLPPDLHWRLAHLGGGPLKEEIEALARQTGIGSRIAFLGARAQPDVVALLREADLFALPSKEGEHGDRDGLPNVIMEAASQGLPIVATRFAGIPEFVRDGQEGILVAAGDWEALSNGLNLLVRDPSERRRLGDGAHSRLVTAFAAEAGLDWLCARLSGDRDPIRAPEPRQVEPA